MNFEATSPRSFPWSFILLTYGLSWTIWIAGWLAAGKPDDLLASSGMMAAAYLGSFGPGLAALVLTARSGGRTAVIDWLRNFVRFRCGWRAYAAAFLPFPIAVLLLTVAFGYTPIPGVGGGIPPILAYATIFPVSIFNGVANVVLGAGPIGEEGGWRGYLLPRLLETRSELRSSLTIGIVWALWHLPVMAMFPAWRDGVDFWVYLPLYVLSVMAVSCLITRVWVIGRGSLVPVIWLHGIFNAVGGMAFSRELWSAVWSEAFGTILFAAAAMAAAAALTRVRREEPEK
jgi:uncharacterized protein